MTDMLPRVGITMGDAAGIGPEITVKSLVDPELYTLCNPVVLGDSRVIKAAVDITQTQFEVQSIGTEEKPDAKPGLINVIDYQNVDPSTYEMGVVKPGKIGDVHWIIGFMK